MGFIYIYIHTLFPLKWDGLSVYNGLMVFNFCCSMDIHDVLMGYS